MSDSVFGLRVPRLCRVRSLADADDHPFPLDRFGFLDGVAASLASRSRPEPGYLIEPVEAVRGGSFVLLGEPGIGKTTAFAMLQGQTGRHISVDGADLETRDDLEQFIIHALDSVLSQDDESASPSDKRVTVVIDQLDESPLLERFERSLKRLLATRDGSRTRFLIGCRTADYPASLTDLLAAATGGCVVADLAPLTRAQAAELASSARIDGRALINAAVQRGAGALASVPLTLELLVRVFKTDDALTASPADLFGEGVRRLLDEWDQQRHPEAEASSVSQRQGVARRAAAYLTLTGRRSIWRGRLLDAGPHDVTVDHLVGGPEPLPQGSFEVRLAHVAETLRTGLFSGGLTEIAGASATSTSNAAVRVRLFVGRTFGEARMSFPCRLAPAPLGMRMRMPSQTSYLRSAVSLLMSLRWEPARDPRLLPRARVSDS